MTDEKKPRKPRTPKAEVTKDTAKQERKAKFREWHKQQQAIAAAKRNNNAN